MNATVSFKSQKQRYRGQYRVFEGNVTITKGTKEFILDKRPQQLREVNVISELALCAFFCFAGIPHHDAQGWILGDIQEKEFEAIKDIEAYLIAKAVIWKKAIHCTEYVEYKGKITQKLKKELEERKLAQKTLFGQVQRMKITKKSNSNNQQNQESDDDDVEILRDIKENMNSSTNAKKRKKKRSLPPLPSLDDYWKPSSPKRRKLG